MNKPAHNPSITVSPAELRDILTGLPHDVPLFVWGPPGVGKTDVIGQFTEKRKAALQVLKASEMRPEDLLGIPMPHEDGYTRFHPPETLLRMTKEWPEARRKKIINEFTKATGHGPTEAEISEAMGFDPGQETILFLDEFSNAPPELNAPFQYLVLNRKLSGSTYTLRDNVRIVAAGNRMEDAAYANELSKPLGSRFAHVEFEATVEDWVAWARGNGINPTIIAFVRSNERQFFNFDAKTHDRTYPCPRTWVQLSRALEGRANDTDHERKIRRVLMEGIVGQGAAIEYAAFERTATLALSADDIIANPGRADTFDTKPELAMVTVENLINASRRDPVKYREGALQYIARMHREYRQIFASTVLNQDGDMPEEVIVAFLEAGNIDSLLDACAGMSEVKMEAEEARRSSAPGRRRGQSLKDVVKGAPKGQMGLGL
jgi:hypothetical protein